MAPNDGKELNSGSLVIQGDALNLPLPNDSVDLVVTSPPYFALRSYQDEGTHYEGQVGSEETPQAFLEALWKATSEAVRVTKPTGSIFVNLGDKYGEKCLLGLPWRYALGCVDRLGLILRAEVVWSKPNCLPESVTDRVRRSHEQWFHFVQSPRYFSAVDEIREPSVDSNLSRKRAIESWDGSGAERVGKVYEARPNEQKHAGVPGVGTTFMNNPLGKIPGSVWTIPTEPLRVPSNLGVDHFAAFPTEWPRKFILGWSPNGVCVECGEGRRPVRVVADRIRSRWSNVDTRASSESKAHGGSSTSVMATGEQNIYAIAGYACACPEPTAETSPAIVLDPFGGTGTTALVARTLGRVGISVDLSHDYCRLARWRIEQSGHGKKALSRTWGERQGGLAV